jgi:lambda family phage portal protein
MASDRINRWVDGAIAVVSPRRAVRRAHYRRMDKDPDYREMMTAVLRARGYRAAKSGDTVTPWIGSGRSADAEILTDLPTLRNRSREVARDDPVASGLIWTFVRNVIGTGLRPQARTDDPEKNKRIEAVFRSRMNDLSPADNLPHGLSQALKFRRVIEDGEMLVKLSKRSAGEPVIFEHIEADRLATPMDIGARRTEGEIRDGVEKDRNGIPVAYWIAKRHPGDTFSLATARRTDFERVEPRAIKHLRIIERPGQTRGVPMFHAILQDLRDLDLLLLASLKRVQIAACLAVFIKSEGDVEEVLEGTAKKEGYVLDQRLEPGMIFKLPLNDDVSTLLPNFPTPEFESFVIMIARRIGAALGVSWQIVLKDFVKSTYSSARTDLLEARQAYTFLQRWFIDSYLVWEWRQVLEDARLRGDPRMAGVTDEDIDRVQWIPNGWRWVDPVKEVMAIKTALELGLTTLQDECARLGKDWEEVVEQRRIEREALGAAGLLDEEERMVDELVRPPRRAPGKNGRGLFADTLGENRNGII